MLNFSYLMCERVVGVFYFGICSVLELCSSVFECSILWLGV